MILIQGGTIVPVVSPPVEEGYILIEGSKIKKIDRGKYQGKDYKTFIDAKNHIIMPGLINTHTHIPMTFFRGIADDLPLEIWLKEYIWPLEAKFIKPDFVYYSSLCGITEMLVSGTTSFCDMYFFENEIARACEDAGIRGFITPGVLDFPTSSFKTPRDAIAKAENFIKNYMKHPIIHPGIAPHSTYTCSLDTLKKCKEISEKYNTIFHIHVSETKKEYEESLKKHGVSPVKYLHNNNLLYENTLAVHSVWLDDEDIELISQKKAKISHNPESNLKLGSGISPVKKLLEQKVRVSIGTDGVASNNNLDMFEAMRITALLHKGINLDPSVLNAREVLKMATLYGAECLNFREIGTLEEGKRADIIIIDIEDISTIPFYDPCSAIIYSLNSRQVKYVIVNGKLVVEKGEIKTVDIEKLKKIAKEYRERIKNAI
jgi:5-methylthioadenosine/S-adenosylhomocysteine deaminase